jgi:hypothetical protein
VYDGVTTSELDGLAACRDLRSTHHKAPWLRLPRRPYRETKDFSYDYFGFKTLERSFLLKVNDQIIERPQYMLMRVTLAIHINNLERAVDSTVRPTLISLWPRAQLLEANTCYDYTSQMATSKPRLYVFRPHLPRPQLTQMLLLHKPQHLGCWAVASVCAASVFLLPLQKQVSFDTNLACGISVGTEFRLVRNSYTISIGTEFIYDLDWYRISESINHL